ncbi:MAG: VOC family protein [Hyphomicrobiaceae bacterium]
MSDKFSIKQNSPLELGICVADLDLMLRFYRDVLGFEYISTYEVPVDKSKPASFSNSGYTIIRLQTPLGERIKLAAPVQRPSKRPRISEVLNRQGDVFITLIVEDLDLVVARLRGTGAEILTHDSKLEVRDGCYLCNLADPEGNYIELVEYRDVSQYRSDLSSG